MAIHHWPPRQNGANGMCDIEGKAPRVGARERGQRTSFNGANGGERSGSCRIASERGPVSEFQGRLRSKRRRSKSQTARRSQKYSEDRQGERAGALLILL